MSLPFFMLVWIAAMLTYGLVAAGLSRRQHAMSVRRLALPRSPLLEERSRSRPRLIDAVDAASGRLTVKLLERLHVKQSIERLLDAASLKWGAAGLQHRSAAFFLGAFGLVTLFDRNQHPLIALAAGTFAGYLPLGYVRHKAEVRVRRFEEQFPDCLEFISRSMRAGHGFSMAIEMVQREFTNPLAIEFRRTFEEQNLGQPIDIVLRKLAQRIPSMDLHFFVSAVVLQKRTGGNLAELLDKLAQLIRERFKLRARIRAVSAQGLMSGRILASIPLAVCVLMFVVNPQYARFFVDDPAGHELMAFGLGLQVVGYLIIKKIVTIEV
jgi:tight adherence protein B